MESQNIEWKQNWKDEYLKWICGFANASGGKIYIGKDDYGNATGISNYKKLMDDIPNKVKDTLGIIIDINLLQENDKYFIEIVVPPSSYPVNYKGEYHYRSGSTKQQIKGAALNEFLLSKTGFKWDAVPVDDVTIEDLDKESFEIFRREALRSGRMTKDDLKMSDEELLDNLNLIDGGKLKRAAILLFHRNPEKWVTGAFTKVAYFGEGSDLRYYDEIHGSLLMQADKVVELIYLKYMKAMISYENVTRIEKYPLPKTAVREIFYNALIHSNYAALIPIQIRIHENEMMISNDCVFPIGWTAETLIERHRSIPYNPNIANTFFRAGYVETWGRGIQKVIEACEEDGVEIPTFKLHPEDIMVTFIFNNDDLQLTSNISNSDKMSELLSELLSESERKKMEMILGYLATHDEITSAAAAELLSVQGRTAQRILGKGVKIGVLDVEGSTKNRRYKQA